MPIKFARRTLLQTGLIAAGVAVSGTLVIAQHASEFEVTEATVPHHIPLQCTPWTQACSVLPG